MQDCGNCTMCCKLPNILETNSPRGEYCKYCEPEIGCKIYDKRPEECKVFQCAWSQMEKVHIDLRPDNCKVMFEKIKSNVIVGTVDGELESVSDLIHRQIDAFCFEGISVFLQQLNPYRFQCKLVKGMTKEEVIQALEDKTNDGTKLH